MLEVRAEPEGRTIDVCASLEGLAVLAPDWIRLCPNAEAHPATFEAVCRANTDLIRPHVVAVRERGVITGMAVSRLQWEQVPARFGFSTVAAPRLRVVRVSYEGVFGDCGPEGLRALLSALAAPVVDGEADAVFFDHLMVGSSAHQAVSAMTRRLFGDPAPERETVHWVADLNGGFDAYWSRLSSSARYNMKKSVNALTRQMGERARFACLEGPDDFEVMVRDTTRVAEVSWHKAYGVSFLDQYWAKPLFESAMRERMAKCFFVYIDGAPVAFYHGTIWKRSFSGSVTGYDPAYAKLGLGKYVLYFALSHLANGGDVDTFDFGFGDAEYKRQLGTRKWMEVDRYLFARRLRPLAVASLRGVVGQSAQRSDEVLRRLGARDAIKRIWWRKATKRD